MNRASLPKVSGFQLALVAAVALVWGHSLSFGFVWDDAYFIQDHEGIRSLLNIPSMFWSLEAQSSYPEGFVLFRPLRTALYAVLYALGGNEARPWLFHLNNLLWHAATVLLFHQLLHRLLSLRQSGSEEVSEEGSATPLSARWIAFVAALGFAVHPVVSEVVCWSKSLDDMMAASFTLGAAVVLMGWQPSSTPASNRPYWFAFALFVLGLYSKLSAIPFAAAAFLLFHFVRREALVRSLKLTLPFAAASLVFLVHRHLVIGRTSQTEPLSGTYLQTLIDTVAVVPTYFRLVAGVPPQSIDYSYLPGGHGVFSGPVLFGAFLLVALGTGAWVWLRQPGRVLVGLGLAWALLFMLPSSNLIPTMQYMAERFLYLPLLGCLMAAAGLLWHFRARPPRVTLAVALSAVTLWAGFAWNRAWIWEDEVTLFLRTSTEIPPTKRVENNAITAVLRLPHLRHVYKTVTRPGALPSLVMQDEEMLRQANWSHVKESLSQLGEFFPTNVTVLTARGFSAAQSGQPREAAGYFEAATRLDPTKAIHWRNLGLARFQAREPAAAEGALLQALVLAPDDVPALNMLSGAYWQQEKFTEARTVLLRLRELDPANPEHAHWLEQVDARLGRDPGQVQEIPAVTPGH